MSRSTADTIVRPEQEANSSQRTYERAIAHKVLELVAEEGFVNLYAELYVDENGVPLECDPSVALSDAGLLSPTGKQINRSTPLGGHFAGNRQPRAIYVKE